MRVRNTKVFFFLNGSQLQICEIAIGDSVAEELLIWMPYTTPKSQPEISKLLAVCSHFLRLMVKNEFEQVKRVVFSKDHLSNLTDCHYRITKNNTR